MLGIVYYGANLMRALMEIYATLFASYGPRHWWPAETPFEMAIGAYLTQNTNWKNVEQALTNLRAINALSAAAIDTMSRARLETMIKPAGFFRQKAERLQLFTRHLLGQYQGQLELMLDQPLERIRAELLALKGIGPETADSILLYAGGHPTFVVDAYTRRILTRLGLFTGHELYAEMRSYFMQELPPDTALYNEYHALIVEHAKRHCRSKPLCTDCPLATGCAYRALSEKSPGSGA